MPLYAPPADLSVTPRKMSDLARTGGWAPTGAIDQTIPDRLSTTGNQALISGQLFVAGGVVLPAGRTITSVSFMSSTTAAVTPTNQWFALIDRSLNVLATTVDDTTTAWAANATKTLLLASALGGASPGTYTAAADMEAYLAVCVVAGTPPNIKGVTNNTLLAAVVPIQSASSTASLTTPASLGSTAGALTATGVCMYGWVS